MFQRLFRQDRDTNRAISEGLYSSIVAAARQPVFYAAWGVPDIPLGRFEMVSLHMLLALRRMRGEASLREVAQAITDQFFLEVDHSLRELGIGDTGVPKRMKKLAKMYYGRATTYSQALDAEDPASLALAIRRNVWPAASDGANPDALAAYTLLAARQLGQQPAQELAAGRIIFPNAEQSGLIYG